MENHICTESFKAFIDKLIAANFFSMQDMYEGLRAGLKCIADEINLGQMSTIYIAPKSDINPNEVHEVILLHVSPDGFEDDPYEKSYATGERGEIMVSMNPKPGTSWDERDLVDIEVVSDLCYLACYRARLAEKIKNASFGPPNIPRG